jgi:flagellar biosynthesis anti-sigma factor FlgM
VRTEAIFLSSGFKKNGNGSILNYRAIPPAEHDMKVNQPNLAAQASGSAQGSAGAARAPQTQRSTPASGNTGAASSASSTTDDVHLSELVRSLRSLAAESPERQNKIEQLTRTYASGSYQVDAQATAGAIISDATKG